MQVAIADVRVPSRKAGRQVKHTVLSSRMLSPVFPPIRDHIESISTSSALSGFTYMATMATQSCNVRMKARAQSADTLAEVCMQCVSVPGNEVAKTSERLHCACHHTAAAALNKVQLKYFNCAYACKGSVSHDCATEQMSVGRRNVFAAHRNASLHHTSNYTGADSCCSAKDIHDGKTLGHDVTLSTCI